jgi:hypothetical protein
MELALERLKERSLLAKTVCPLPRPPNPTATADGDGDENEYDAILAPLIHALLEGSLACGLALLDSVGPGAVARVYDAVGRAVVAAAGAGGRRRWEVPILGKHRWFIL